MTAQFGGHGPSPGLCGRCAHVKVIESRKGSRFHLCRLASTDARFRRYPPLPVLSCPGFEPGGGATSDSAGGSFDPVGGKDGDA